MSNPTESRKNGECVVEEDSYDEYEEKYGDTAGFEKFSKKKGFSVAKGKKPRDDFFRREDF